MDSPIWHWFHAEFFINIGDGGAKYFCFAASLMRQHVGALILFCALSDAMLIILGVGGLTSFLGRWLTAIEKWLFAGAALWLGVYALMRGIDAWRGHDELQASAAAQNGLMTTLAMAAVLTFGNPHVYLDTMFLIGMVSLQFEDTEKIAFAGGAITASFVFFTGLGFGRGTFRVYATSKCVAHIGCGCVGGNVDACLRYGTSRRLAIKSRQ